MSTLTNVNANGVNLNKARRRGSFDSKCKYVKNMKHALRVDKSNGLSICDAMKLTHSSASAFASTGERGYNRLERANVEQLPERGELQDYTDGEGEYGEGESLPELSDGEGERDVSTTHNRNRRARVVGKKGAK